MVKNVESQKRNQGFKIKTAPLVAGGCAGFAVAFVYYPLDTLKTRLQSPQGFRKAGGFRGVYKGCSTLVAAAVPTNSFFFCSYETLKFYVEPLVAPKYQTFAHVFCASCCRVMTSTFREPIEVAIQRQQVYQGKKAISAFSVLLDAYRKEGIRRGWYRGYLPSILRDVPYSLLEMPTWELLKSFVRGYNNGQITVLQSAGCGFCASAFAAFLTTPCDVIKTRTILAQRDARFTYAQIRLKAVFTDIIAQHGIKGLFKGVTPRLLAVSGGRFLFFTVYEESRKLYEQFMKVA